MKYTTQGNCPYCDSELGVHSGWGMSPEGFADFKRKHDLEHPENQPNTANLLICPHCHTEIKNTYIHGRIN